MPTKRRKGRKKRRHITADVFFFFAMHRKRHVKKNGFVCTRQNLPRAHRCQTRFGGSFLFWQHHRPSTALPMDSTHHMANTHTASRENQPQMAALMQTSRSISFRPISCKIHLNGLHASSMDGDTSSRTTIPDADKKMAMHEPACENGRSKRQDKPMYRY